MVLLMRLAKVLYRRTSEERVGMRARQLVALSYLRDHGGAARSSSSRRRSASTPTTSCCCSTHSKQRATCAAVAIPPTAAATSCELTASGASALARAERAQAELEHEILAGLSPRERASLRDLLARALEATEEPEPAGERVGLRA